MRDRSPGDYTQTAAAQHDITSGTRGREPHQTLLGSQLGAGDTQPIETLIDTPVPEVDVLLPENADALREELGLNPDSWLVSPELCEG